MVSLRGNQWFTQCYDLLDGTKKNNVIVCIRAKKGINVIVQNIQIVLN